MNLEGLGFSRGITTDNYISYTFIGKKKRALVLFQYDSQHGFNWYLAMGDFKHDKEKNYLIGKELTIEGIIKIFLKINYEPVHAFIRQRKIDSIIS